MVVPCGNMSLELAKISYFRVLGKAIHGRSFTEDTATKPPERMPRGVAGGELLPNEYTTAPWKALSSCTLYRQNLQPPGKGKNSLKGSDPVLQSRQ